MRSAEIRLIRRPVGPPVAEDFQRYEREVPEPGDSEVVVRNPLMALGAAMRSLLAGGLGPVPGCSRNTPSCTLSPGGCS